MYTEVFNGNYHIRLGKNKQENDTIIRTSPQTALWFHLKDFPSAHAVVTNIVKPGVYDKEVIIRASTLVKDNAKQGVNNLQKLSVNYLPIKNVRRTEIPGQVFLTKTPKTIQV
jgi:predicted ribosome quality control (RQC) complex YloA/Tae2 family protein